MESKHTPGPWQAAEAGGGYNIESRSPEMSATVAVICARRSVTGEADAHLIAAAPDLLAALERLDAKATDAIEWLQTHQDPKVNQQIHALRGVQLNARAAILKAWGE